MLISGNDCECVGPVGKVSVAFHLTAEGMVSADGGKRLDMRYTCEVGATYLTGVQALIRVVLDRARLDRTHGKRTAAYVSGYEGSPLAGLDLELGRLRALLDELAIHHVPGLNEELAATAVSGTQVARTVADLRPDGVCGYWYGKAPGLDRASDAFRHAVMIGTDPGGGAVAFVGDDPAAKSSSVPCSSEMALAELTIPTLVPADPAEILDLGRHAVELSRASGLWTALRVATVVADGASTVALDTGWRAPDLTASGLNPYTHHPTAQLLGANLAGLERSLHEHRLPIAVEYLCRSGINRIEGAAAARVGIVAAGPTYLVMRQALSLLGFDDATLEARGIRLLKLGAVYPLEPAGLTDFANGLRRILVVEDKRAFLEPAIKAALYGRPDAPGIDGKHDSCGRALLSPLGELDVAAVAEALTRWLPAVGIEVVAEFTPRRPRQLLPIAGSGPRTPFFCSGCPHNTSTEVAPGTLVGAGIGCHTMLLVMPGSERAGEITGIAQMGGEGGHWLGMAPFVEQTHLVQNIGDGTFAHSGSLAIRAAVAANASITFKLLRNSAVAMTGGQQPVGELSLRQVVALLRAEGVRRVVVTTDDVTAVRKQLGRGVDVRSRDDLVAVQTELAAVKGVTVLIHEQECAAELRRKRKRGKAPKPRVRAFINQRVCEGCGDCGATSNCLSVQPVNTDFGRKTEINQSSCNLDFSCLDGDCPSFLTVTPRERPPVSIPTIELPPEPRRPVQDSFHLRITGIGGTGVTTVAQIVANAASMEGSHVRALDQTGLAQKGGPVVSDVVITSREAPRGPRLGPRECDLYLGGDILVAANPDNLTVCDPHRTKAVVSSAEVPTGQMVIDTAAVFPDQSHTRAALVESTADAAFVDCLGPAREHLGDEQYANVVLLGVAYQRGWLPVGGAAIESAIRLNGAAADANIAAFRLGRRLAHSERNVPRSNPEPEELSALIGRLSDELRAYQNDRYARRFTDVVRSVLAREAEINSGTQLTECVARNLFKLMAYKDEYEVARLSIDPALTAAVRAEFGEGAAFAWRLHPPILRALGMKRKISLGHWFRPVFTILAALRILRGTRLDVFGWTEVRRMERRLISEYIAAIDEVQSALSAHNHAVAIELAGLPDLVRGYEHVKSRNVEIYRTRLASLIERYREASEGAVSTAAGRPAPLDVSAK